MKLTKKCISVANYIIEETNKYNEGKSLKEKVFLSNKRLQKLVYFCEIQYMKNNYGKPLFEDEYYAWASGPVIPEIYSVFMEYQERDLQPKYEYSDLKLSCDVKKIIDEILNATKDLDTRDLINISNVPGGPYDKVFDYNDIRYEKIISKKSICDYYGERDLVFQLTHKEYGLGSLSLDEIKKLKDKSLQLRYLLGALYPDGGMMECDKFLECDRHCSTRPVKIDNRLDNVKKFMLEHNMSNETFIKLAKSYLSGTINSYKGEWGNLIPELDRVIMDYGFLHTNYDSFSENDLREKELMDLIMNEAHVEGSYLNTFLKKYSLTTIDFMILAKTSINYKFKNIRYFDNDDLFCDLEDILIVNNLYLSYEYVNFYRVNLKRKEKKENSKKLIRRIKNIFKK